MKKKIFPALIATLYIAALIKVMVFKDIPTIKLGSLMLNFGGTDASHPANFIPFKTILYYFAGGKGFIIGGINIIGNIILLVPLGFILPFVYRKMTWGISFTISVLSGLIIELLQVILHVGIFDIDDVILNALGFLIGYGIYRILTSWIQSKKYTYIVVSSIAVIVLAAAIYKAVVYPITHQTVNPQMSREGKDPCRGTGGNGEITELKTNELTLRKKEGDVVVNYTSDVEINTSQGKGTISDLKVGKRITLVGDAQGNSFRADALFICGKE